MDEAMVKSTVRLPESLWRAARIRALDERLDFQAVVAKALEAYLRTAVPKASQAKPKKRTLRGRRPRR